MLSANGTVSSASVSVPRSKLTALIRATSAFADDAASRGPTARTRGDQAIPLVMKPQAAWRELYDLLILPVAGHLPAAAGSRLTIVPHGPLIDVPFAALRDAQGRYLLERYAIHSLTAGAMLEYTKTRGDANPRAGSMLLVADPAQPPKIAGEPPLPRLPGANAEVREIAKLLPAARTMLLADAAATEPKVLAATANRSVLHFATHAIVRDADPLSSFLALGREGAASGQLTAQKIYDLRLDANLVVLSACRSGEGVPNGDGIAALARAFFYAGTSSLIVSLWDIADEPSNRLLPAFYREWLKGTDKARALRAAQLQLIADLRAGRVKVSTPAGDIVVPGGSGVLGRLRPARRARLTRVRAEFVDMRFRDRVHAGRELARLLARYAHRPDVIVLGLPRGGMPVAAEVARALGVPFDVFLVRKLGVPGHEELAFGAIAQGGVQVLNDALIADLDLPPSAVERVAARERAELERRDELYRGGRPFPALHDRTVILIDDGLATGATMEAAVTALRRLDPARVVVAAPVGARETCDRLSANRGRGRLRGDAGALRRCRALVRRLQPDDRRRSPRAAGMKAHPPIDDEV